MTFNNVNLDGQAILAPMAGITDSSFRLICRELGASMVFSEMISADGLFHKNENTQNLLFYRQEEHPIGFQLFGVEANMMAIAVEMVMTFKPDFIDLNFGCPVKKVVKKGAGAALLNDIPNLKNITKTVVRNSPVPVLAKIRKGWDERNANAVEIAQILEQCGVKAITIHPRTQTQQFKGTSDWNVITKIKKAVSIPVIGSGDIKTAGDAKKMIEITGCDLVMIGRGCLGNPWIFKQTNHYLKTGELLPPPTPDERLQIILKHLDDRIQQCGVKNSVFEMRKHFAWYLKGLPECTNLKSELFKTKDIEQIKTRITNYFQALIS